MFLWCKNIYHKRFRNDFMRLKRKSVVKGLDGKLKSYHRQIKQCSSIPTYQVFISLQCKGISFYGEIFRLWSSRLPQPLQYRGAKYIDQSVRGVLGIRRTNVVNTALLAKLEWKILNNPDNIRVKVILTKYLNNLSFLEMKKTIKASTTWNTFLIADTWLKGVYDGSLVMVEG